MRRGWGGESEAELQPCVRARIVACSRGARAPGKNRGVGERGKAGLGTPGICSIRGPPCPLAVHALGCLSPSAFLPFLANLMPLPHPPHPDAQGRVPPPASSSGRQHDDSVARTLDPDLDDNPSSANAYEAARAARITANRARLASLGVMKAAASARPTLAVKVPPAPHHRRPRPPPSPTTRSLRPRPPRASPPPWIERAAATPRRRHASRSLYFPDGQNVPVLIAPFATSDGAFTIHCLGRLVSDGEAGGEATAPLYWSSTGARFHHPYPVGYRATRYRALGGRDFSCSVDAGPAGPLFTVTDLVTGKMHTGPSPTRPWTLHCMSTGTGVRVSGPLFYGFADPHVQAALRAMAECGAAAAEKEAAAPAAKRTTRRAAAA